MDISEDNGTYVIRCNTFEVIQLRRILGQSTFKGPRESEFFYDFFWTLDDYVIDKDLDQNDNPDIVEGNNTPVFIIKD